MLTTYQDSGCSDTLTAVIDRMETKTCNVTNLISAWEDVKLNNMKFKHWPAMKIIDYCELQIL